MEPCVQVEPLVGRWLTNLTAPRNIALFGTLDLRVLALLQLGSKLLCFSYDLYNYKERRNIMSNLVRWDPFAELSALQKQFFGDDFMSPLKGVNIPTTDVYTKDNQLTVEAH